MGLREDAQDLKGLVEQLQDQFKNLGQSADFSESIGNSLDLIKEAGTMTKEQLATAESQLETAKKQLSAESSILQEKIKSNKETKKALSDEIGYLKKISQEEANSGKFTAERQDRLRKIQQEYDDISIKLSQQQKGQAAITQAMGKTVAAADDLGKELEDAFNKKPSEQYTSGLLQGFKKAGTGAVKALEGISTPLDGLLSPLNLINKLISFFVGSVLDADTQIGEVAKGLNMSYREAGANKTAMIEFAEATGDAFHNSEELGKSLVNINKSLGTSVGFADMSKPLQEDLALMTKLQQTAGYTEEETAGIMKFTMATGKSTKASLKDFAKGFKMQGLKSKLVLNEKEAMKEIGKLSKSVQISIKGGAEGLGEAMAAAKALGTDLGKVDDIAGSLLNFEESIANELEAELLTGKELNLEKARQAAMDNDLATLAKEIKNEVGSAADFADMNRVQQEAIAKAMGMSREEMSSMLMEQEALAAMNVESAAAAQEKFDALVAEHDLAYAMEEMGTNALTKQMEQATLQENAAASQKAMADEMVKTMIPAMTNLNDNFQKMFNKAKKIFKQLGGMKTLFIAIGAIITTKMAVGLANSLISIYAQLASAKAYRRELNRTDSKLTGIAAKESAIAAAKVAGAEASTLGAATVPIIAGITAVMAVLGGLMMMSDGMIGPSGKSGFGDRVLLAKEGAIAFNNKDTIVAGTDLYANDAISSPGQATKTSAAGSVSMGDMSTVVAAINDLSTKVEAMANRPINVGIDGKKVVEAGTGDNPNTFGEEVGKNSFDLQ